ncbi:MAG TPA: SIMPL domain-containing protein [Steroidobacteraceae bacterium]|nr:SIMPL domain-containing protein [Steroidobacteraceae bacterium]
MKSTAAVLVALLGLWGAQSARSAGPPTPDTTPTIEVTGNGEVVVDPDRATLTIAVQAQGASSAAAASNNAHLTAAVTGALLTVGAARADIETANYTVLPQWQYSNNAPPKRIGYQAQNTIRVSVKQLALLGRWMDAALNAGASRIDNVEFDSGKTSAARLDALAKAVANARMEAETLAKAAGGSLGALQELSAVPASGLRFPLRAAPGPITVTAQRRQAEETQIEPSPLHINAVVTARWRFEP